MAIEIEEMGPVDWLVVEFPGKEPTGELMPPLLDLVDRRLIRILDAMLFVKDADGSVVTLSTEDLDPDQFGDLGDLAGASSGLIHDDDALAVAEVLEPNSRALMLVYENVWAAPFAVAMRNAGGQLVDSGRIPVQAILARLDELEA